MTANVSVIVRAPRHPEPLDRALSCLSRQQVAPREVLVAGDGSTPHVAELVDRWRERLSGALTANLEASESNPAATVLNKAVARSTGDYLIFLDGECLVFPDFIARHVQLATPGQFVTGDHVLATPELTLAILATAERPMEWTNWKWIGARLSGRYRGWLPTIRLRDGSWRQRGPQEWRSGCLCNLGAWRRDFLAINGFDEIRETSAHEESELVARLIGHGVRRKDGRFAATVLRLWDPESEQASPGASAALLQAIVSGARSPVAERGIDQNRADAQ